MTLSTGARSSVTPGVRSAMMGPPTTAAGTGSPVQASPRGAAGEGSAMPGARTCPPRPQEPHVRRIPIRMKLAGALAVPLLALVVVTVLEVVQAARDADRGPRAAGARRGHHRPRQPAQHPRERAQRGRASTCSTRSRRSRCRSRTTPRPAPTPTPRWPTCATRWRAWGVRSRPPTRAPSTGWTSSRTAGRDRRLLGPAGLSNIGPVADVLRPLHRPDGRPVRGQQARRARRRRPRAAPRRRADRPQRAPDRTSSPSWCATCCSPRSAAPPPTG